MPHTLSPKTKERLFFLRCSVGLFVFCCLVFLLLRDPEATRRGVAAGVRLCLQTLIPSMLPLLILAAFFQRSSLGAAATRLLEVPMRLLLGVSGAGAGAVLFSVLGGFPAGAQTICEAVDQKALTRREGRVLQLLCFCPSAAFTVGAVGGGMLGSVGAGLLLEGTVLMPLLVLAVPLRLRLRGLVPSPVQKKAALSDAEAFTAAVANGAQTMLLICAFVCLFSALPAVLAAFPIPERLRVWVNALPELTGGVRAAAKELSLPSLAGLLSFGGFCAHCQVLPSLQKLRLRYFVFLLFRLAHAGLSALVCWGLCRLIPIRLAVFAGQGAAFAPSAASSAAVSVCMVCMCALLLLGSGTTVKCYA